MLSFPDLNEYI